MVKSMVKYQVFYKNNNKLRYKGNYNNGLMDGKWTYYWENGNKKVEGSFKNGNGSNKNKITKVPTNGRDGIWSSWHINGEKWFELNFINGKKNGKQTNWYDNGQKEVEGNYENDEPVKIWLWWYIDGTPMQEGDIMIKAILKDFILLIHQFLMFFFHKFDLTLIIKDEINDSNICCNLHIFLLTKFILILILMN